MFLRLKSERVNIHSGRWDTGVELVRLDQIVVSGLSGGNSVMGVELDLGINNWVVSGVWVRSSSIVSEISPSVSTSSNVGIRLNNPDEFFTWVRKVKLLSDRCVTV